MVADTLFPSPALCEVENERVPLAPTEKSNNAGISRKPRKREVSSRYKTALQPPPSRRFPSPNIGRNADAAPPEPPKRALSAERKRSTGAADTITSTSTDEGTRPSNEMWSPSQRSTDSLETQAAGNENSRLDHALKPAANGMHQSLGSNTGRSRRATPERKRNPGWRQSTDQAENARPFENLVARSDLQKWPGTTNGKSISRSMDLSLERDRGRPSCIGTRVSRCLAPARSFNQLMSLNGNQEPVPALSPSATTKVSCPSRALPSPTRTRTGAFPMPPNGIQQSVRPSSVACMLNFGVDSYKGKKGMSQQEEAQYLRLLHNRWLQWRFTNARAEAAMNSQKATAERILYNASMQISDLRSTVATKRVKLQQARQTEKLHSMIASHGKHLEEWAELEQEHSFALSGAIEALEAGTLKVPITGGAKIDVQALSYALNCAADAMTSLESSAGSLLPNAEKTSGIACELAQVAAQEKALLQECGDLLDRIATLEVEERSLRSYFLQLGNEKKRLALGSSCSN